MTENDVNPPITNDPMEKRNEFIDHPSYLRFNFQENNITLACNACHLFAGLKSGEDRGGGGGGHETQS